MAWWWNSPVRFPTPKPLSPIGSRPIRALPPATPSIPSLVKGKPTPVPGLEQQSNCFSVCLTPDMKQIVFGRLTDSTTGIDLYHATRDNVNQPFQAPKRIESTVSAETEAYPAISPDGLELFFVRPDHKPMIWVTRRDDDSAAFGTPEQWWYCQASGSETPVGTPQVLSPDLILFARYQHGMAGGRIWSCERAVGDRFLDPIRFSAPEGEHAVYFNLDGLRAYILREQSGVYLTSRPKMNAPYFPPDALLSGTVTGPLEGSLWVAPMEDVLFYTSAGPGKTIGNNRRLWMIGF